MMAPPTMVRAWSCIIFVAALAIAGECLIAAAMRRLGDLDALRTGTGLLSYLGPIRAVPPSPPAPATGSPPYVGNAIAAKLFLHENVDRRRWLATSFLAVGVVLVSR